MSIIEQFKRQLDLVDYDKLAFPITILGVGGIGSWTALMLAKMGCQNISVVDDDQVEEHNVASQFYKPNQLGNSKTGALNLNVLEHTGVEIMEYPISLQEKAIEEKSLVIIAVDSMKARKQICEQIEKRNIYVIDARMGGLQLELYNCPANQYRTTLVEEEAVQHEKCTGKAISFNCATIGSFIANYVRLYSRQELEDNAKGIVLLFHKGIDLLRN